jgi:hypothetical protein
MERVDCDKRLSGLSQSLCTWQNSQLNWQTAASITRLQFSEWYGTSKQKFKLFIFLLVNNCYKVALCTPLHAWHGHVAPHHINWSSDAMVIVASNTCRIWLPDLSPNLVLFGWPKKLNNRYPNNQITHPNNQIFGYLGDPNNQITKYWVIRVTRITKFGDSDEFRWVQIIRVWWQLLKTEFGEQFIGAKHWGHSASWILSPKYFSLGVSLAVQSYFELHVIFFSAECTP